MKAAIMPRAGAPEALTEGRAAAGAHTSTDAKSKSMAAGVGPLDTHGQDRARHPRGMTLAPPHIFFYGSLLTGTGVRAVDRVLARHLRFIDRACIRARLYLLDGYPGAVPATAAGAWVVGKVFRLRGAHRALRVLDAYEGYLGRGPRSEFVRARAVARCRSGVRLPVWVYYYNRPVKRRRRIADGDYLGGLRR